MIRKENFWMLVSDKGAKGPIVCTINRVFKDENYINHFELLIFSKESYEYFTQPKKLNSYLFHLPTTSSVPVGQMMIVAVEKPSFSYLTFDFTYSTIGVTGIAMPVGELNADIFPDY